MFIWVLAPEFQYLIQKNKPSWLPSVLRDWTFLPLWMRSLKPIDDVFSNMRCCRKCQGDVEKVAVQEDFDDIEAGEANHLSIIKLKSKDSNENALNNCHEMESLVVNG